MTYNLPTGRRRLVHKPVELRNLSKKMQAAVDPLDPEQYALELKYDGCHMIVVKQDGKAYAFSREGNEVQSCNHILREIERHPIDNFVFFGEAWDDRKQHSEISGDFRRFAPALNLWYVVFDGVPLADFERGQCDIRYTSRRWHLESTIAGLSPQARVTLAKVGKATADNYVEYLRAAGYPCVTDGYVAKAWNGIWIAGDGKGGEQIKVKNHVSVDIRCIGLEMGEGKFAGMVGSLVCEYGGKVITVGGGKLTNQERMLYWADKSQIVGKIVEVHALGDSQHGVLREPRFIRIRDDKNEPSE